MQTILTLITSPSNALLDSDTRAQLGAVIGVPAPVELAPKIAYEWQGEFNASHTGRLRAAIGDRPIDVALTPATNRRKMLLVADMDSTMIAQECIDELGDALGLRQKISAITEHAMNGEIDFRAALDERVGLLKGLTIEKMAHIRDTAITKTSGGDILLSTMKAHGAYAALVSGGFTFFAERIATDLRFDECTANKLLIENDKLTGKVGEPISDKHTKKARLLALSNDKNIDPALTMAVGDGANDLEMIKIASLGVAFHAKPTVAQQADVRIDHGDLTALLYIQGYTQSEFIT